MKKSNIAITVLSAALLFAIGAYISACTTVSQIRTTHRLVRLSSQKIWRQGCEHAAAGDPKRSRWCDWAAKETALSVAENVTDEEMTGLAFDFLRRENQQRGK